MLKKKRASRLKIANEFSISARINRKIKIIDEDNEAIFFFSYNLFFISKIFKIFMNIKGNAKRMQVRPIKPELTRA